MCEGALRHVGEPVHRACQLSFGNLPKGRMDRQPMHDPDRDFLRPIRGKWHCDTRPRAAFALEMQKLR
jgi:hypothetical protein